VSSSAGIQAFTPYTERTSFITSGWRVSFDKDSQRTAGTAMESCGIKIFRATARRDGRVRYNGRYYSSLSLAGKAAIKRSVNGWWFWQVERGKGNWARLKKIREAGTPVDIR
jgi:hypothetical protein